MEYIVKKHFILSLFALAFVFALGSCKQNSEDATIVGTWSLSTIQGVPVTLVNSSGTLVVASDMTFTQNLDLNGTPGSSSGTVTDNGGDKFNFVYTGDITTPGGYAATMSSDGKTLSFPSLSILGSVTWTK